MPLTPEQEELKTFAQRAAEGSEWYTAEDILNAKTSEWRFLVQDANFITCAQPSVILALLAQIEAMP